MKILVAGGSGFLGRACIARLLADGHEIVAASRRASARPIAGTVALDIDAGQPIDPADVGGCTAIVNLVGIARARPGNDFAHAHVAAARELVALGQTLGVKRFVHVGVIDTSTAHSPYHTTKRAADELIRASALPWTILRPSAVFGPGDQLLTNLVTQVRTAALFPVPRTRGPLALLDVDDVSDAIAAVLHRDVAIGRCYDLVGPARLDVREMVHAVAGALELPTWAPAVPDVLLGAVAWVGEAILERPPLARSQLVMLQRGLAGDGAQATAELGLASRPFSPTRIAALAQQIPPPRMSLRLFPNPAHRRWFTDVRVSSAAVPWALAVMVAMLLLPALVEGLWIRMLAIELVAAPLAVALISMPWGRLAQLRPTMLATGLVGAAFLYIGARAAVAAGQPFAITAQLALVYEAMTAIPSAYAMILLPIVVVAEDITFRVAITTLLARRTGPVAASLMSGAAFAIAHLTAGPPILVLAALVLGTIWSALFIRTRSLVAVVTMHLGFDALVLWGPRLG